MPASQLPSRGFACCEVLVRGVVVHDWIFGKEEKEKVNSVLWVPSMCRAWVLCNLTVLTTTMLGGSGPILYMGTLRLRKVSDSPRA